MARRKHAEEHEGEHDNSERWLLTYADMITLLMTFFVVLYAISNTDLRKFTAIAQSFSSAFNADVFQGTQAMTITAGQESAPDVSNFDSGSGLMSADFRALQATVRDFAITQGIDGLVQVDRVPEGIAIRISESLLFQSGRAVLDEQSRSVLGQIAGVLAPLTNQLRIEGNTDDVLVANPFFKDNWELSTARALAVLDVLRDLGIAPDRLSAAGNGQYHPLVPNTNDAARARNRRVDIVILYAAEAAASPSSSPAAGPFSIGGLP
jgi:chemotaxis protein MotB